ncbi:peptidylprolyl isomerase [Paenibacillus sp. GCM10023252]|uniref:peptidylprolyl isomerase n=1 Tax=Paenibacillus sp. GCM10023252 TaxID=3252649 RepID=UPI0036165DC8
MRMIARRSKIFLFLVAMFLITACYAGEDNRPGEEAVIKVNGSLVTKKELEWITGQSGLESGVELSVKEQALAVRTRVIQLEAVKRSIPVPIGEKSFLEAMDVENLRRSKALENNEPIYGPKQYTEKPYYHSLMTKAERALKDKLRGKEIDSSQEKLLAYYEAHKDKLARKMDSYWLEALVEPGESHDARKRAELLLDRLSAGEPFEKLYAERRSLKGLTAEEQINDADRRNVEKYREALYEGIKDMKVGEVRLAVIQDQDSFKIIRCVKRQQGGYSSFEEVRDNVTERYLEQEFDRIVKQWIDLAEIKVYH